MNEIQDINVFNTEIRQLFEIFQYRKNKAGLKQLLQENSEYRKMDADTLEVLSVLLNTPRIWEDRMKYMDIEGEKEEYDMCQALREWIEEEREAGMEEGRTQGRVEGRAQGKIESILYLLAGKGEVSEDLYTYIIGQRDATILQQWLLAAAKAGNIEEFVALIHFL